VKTAPFGNFPEAHIK